MAGFGGFLAGAGRAIQGFDAQQQQETERRRALQALSMQQFQDQQARQAAQDTTRANAGLVNLYGQPGSAVPPPQVGALPGAVPAPQPQGPQPPMPGQASVQAQQRPPMGGGMPAPGGAAPPPMGAGAQGATGGMAPPGPGAGGAPPQQQPGGQAGFKLPPPDPNDIGDPRTFVMAYKRSNPDATPGEIMTALNQSQAIMNPQKKFELEATKVQLGAMQKMMDLQEKYYSTDKKAGTSITIQNMKEGAAERKVAAGAMDDDTKRFIAERLLAGDTTAAQGLGYGSVGAANRAAVMKTMREIADDRGIDGKEAATRIAEFQGLKAGERALGTRTATMGMAVNEAKRIAPLALQASAAIDRTRFPTINAMEQAVRKGTGDPNIARFMTAHNSLINVYARAISPTGVPTVSDKDHAREILDTAYSEGQYEASVDQMMKEMAAAQQSPGDVKKELRGEGGGSSEGAANDPLGIR